MPVLTTRANASAINTLAKKKVLPYQWVLVGDSGNLWTSTSTTASSWTQRTSSFSTTEIRKVASNGKDLYVAVGLSGKLATSPDGITWTQRTSSFSTSDIFSVAYGGGYWVASGADNKVAYSTDGITWTQTTSFFASGNNNDVAYGNGKWVASDGAELWTASNPSSTWTLKSGVSVGGYANGLLYWPAQSLWIASAGGGPTGSLKTATDPTGTWTSRNTEEASTLGIWQIACNGEAAVVSTNTSLFSPVVYKFHNSTDGTTWNNRTSPYSTSVIYAGASDESGLVAYTAHKTDGTTSTNGAYIQTSSGSLSTWTGRGRIANFSPRNICHSSGTPSIR